MSLNENNDTFDVLDNLSNILQVIIIFPDYINLVCLSFGVYGMYRAIAIQHPLYAILFLNLVVPLVLTCITIVAFMIIPNKRFVVLANTCSLLSLFFHCTCWCVSSIIRYVYIIHDVWIHKHIPSTKHQCALAFVFAFTAFTCFSAPIIGYALHLGNK